MSGVIDAHQHVWDLDRARYDWLTPEAGVLYRSFGMEDVLPAFEATGVTGTVLVQSADDDDDTDLMFEAAAVEPLVLGVVGYVALEDPERAGARLDEMRQRPRFCGVRTLMHMRPDPHWLRRADVDAGLGLLEASAVPLDIPGVLPEHLEAALEISERHPDLAIVLDHLSHPPIGRDDLEPWASLISRVAENPRVFGKVSGLYSTVGDPGDWTVDRLRPVFDHALAAFGPDRLMYGGDWPVSLISGGYERVFRGIATLVADLDPRERDLILAGTARRFYSLPDTEGPR